MSPQPCPTLMRPAAVLDVETAIPTATVEADAGAHNASTAVQEADSPEARPAEAEAIGDVEADAEAHNASTAGREAEARPTEAGSAPAQTDADVQPPPPLAASDADLSGPASVASSAPARTDPGAAEPLPTLTASEADVLAAQASAASSAPAHTVPEAPTAPRRLLPKSSTRGPDELEPDSKKRKTGDHSAAHTYFFRCRGCVYGEKDTLTQVTTEFALSEDQLNDQVPVCTKCNNCMDFADPPAQSEAEEKTTGKHEGDQEKTTGKQSEAEEKTTGKHEGDQSDAAKTSADVAQTDGAKAEEGADVAKPPQKRQRRGGQPPMSREREEDVSQSLALPAETQKPTQARGRGAKAKAKAEATKTTANLQKLLLAASGRD